MPKLSSSVVVILHLSYWHLVSSAAHICLCLSFAFPRNNRALYFCADPVTRWLCYVVFDILYADGNGEEDKLVMDEIIKEAAKNSRAPCAPGLTLKGGNLTVSFSSPEYAASSLFRSSVAHILIAVHVHFFVLCAFLRLRYICERSLSNREMLATNCWSAGEREYSFLLSGDDVPQVLRIAVPGNMRLCSCSTLSSLGL